MPDFVNPYTFIPLPDPAPPRGRPTGHEQLTYRSGRLRIALRAESALIIRDRDQTDHVPTTRNKVVFHGSALHGAVRSLHETLSGGCLRVIDPDYVPGYRQEVQAGLDNLSMAIVSGVDANGAATQVRLCESETWVDAAAMERELGQVNAGEHVYIRQDLLLDQSRWRRDRYEIHAALVRGQQGWISRSDSPVMAAAPLVVFITDTAARPAGHGHYWCVGMLTDDYANVTERARQGFAAAVAGTNDVREAANGAGGELQADVRRNNTTFGRRFTSRTRLEVGQPVWVRLGEGSQAKAVDEIRLAKIWREPGQGPLKNRVDPAFLPCKDPADLCPSCQIFGSAEERPPGKQETDESVQLSYAGHVSIGDALSSRPAPEVIGATETIAPLMGPHPGSGHFYLEPPADPGYRNPTTWGAPADRGTPRRIRGRKFYWASQAANGRSSRAVPRGQQNTQRAIRIKPVKAGTEFVVEVQFENLTDEQLGGLAVAFKPDLLFPDAVLSIGGGKPFGFGAVSARLEVVDVHGPAQRYGDAEQLDGEAALSTAVESYRTWRQRTGGFAQVDAAAGHVLARGFIDDRLISYPFDDAQRHAQNPTPGYRFFKSARGGSAGNAARPLFLPDPSRTAAQQVMNSRHGA